MTCLRLIRQRIFAIVTPIALGEISARRWKFSYRESLRACYDTLPIPAVLLRFLSEMEEDILSMRSRVFSHSHTIASDFHLYLFDIVLPVLKYQRVPLIPIFFSRNFRTVPLEYTLGWNNRNGNLYRFKVPFSQRSKHRVS